MTVDEIYNLVATSIFNSIKADTWEKAVLNIHGGSTSISYDGYYISNNIKYFLEVRSFDIKVLFAIRELHKITTEGNSNPWNCAVFTLLPSRQFNIDFSLEEDI